MAKYRGKYQKCRTCVNVEDVLMWMVAVSENCPKKINFSGSYMVDKPTCEGCSDYIPRNAVTAYEAREGK